ncbi:MAG: flippase-like domain-containing protein [Ktedonobacteraceae bacterium]|nr:flippase-like domain-containing protein [Ktedonobacteraceae bacterium]
MSTFPQPTARPTRLRDYGAFQTDVSTLDTLTITTIQRQKEVLPPEPVHNDQKMLPRFPESTAPSGELIKSGNTTSSIRSAFLVRARKAVTHKWPGVLMRFCVTIDLLAYLFKSLSWQMLLIALIHVHAGDILVGLVVGGSGIALSSYQWRVLLRAQHIHFDFADLIKLYTIGITISHFLPTGFGGDAFKSFYVGRKSRNGVGATTATIMCRVTGFAGMLLLVFPVLIILHALFPFLLTLSFMLLCLLGCAVIVGMLSLALMLPALSKKKWRWRHFFERMANIGAVLQKSVLMPRPIFSAILCGTLFWLVAILNCYVYANALGIHEHLAFYFLAVPLAAIIASLPVSLNGFGLREGAFVYILSFVHVIPGTAMLLVLMLDLQSLFFALIGGGIYFTLGSRKRKMPVEGKLQGKN